MASATSIRTLDSGVLGTVSPTECHGWPTPVLVRVVFAWTKTRGEGGAGEPIVFASAGRCDVAHTLLLSSTAILLLSFSLAVLPLACPSSPSCERDATPRGERGGERWVCHRL